MTMIRDIILVFIRIEPAQLDHQVGRLLGIFQLVAGKDRLVHRERTEIGREVKGQLDRRLRDTPGY